MVFVPSTLKISRRTMSKRDAYELLETIGEGAYGKALLAKDGEGNKSV